MRIQAESDVKKRAEFSQLRKQKQRSVVSLVYVYLLPFVSRTAEPILKPFFPMHRSHSSGCFRVKLGRLGG